MTPVTDPLILKQLQDAPEVPGGAPGTPVTDPLILRQLMNGNPLADPNTGQIITRAPGGTSTPGTDLLYGFRKPIDNLAVLSGRAVEGAFPALGLDTPGWATGLRVGAQEAARNARQEYERVHAGGPPDDSAMTKAGSEIIPAITAYAMPGSTSARFLPRTLSNMGSGAATTLMTGDPNAPVDQLAGQAALGAGVGAGSSMLMGGAARAFDPAMAQPGSDVRKLFDMGVRPTPGQAAGGTLNKVEQGMTRLPFVGDLIQASRRRAGLELNTGAINDVLAPIKERLPQGMEPGRDALNYMADRASDAYRAAVPQAGSLLDPAAQTSLQNLKQLAQSLPDTHRNEFNNRIKMLLEDRLAPNGFLTGDSYKAAESDLGKRANDFIYNPNSNTWDKDLGNAFREAQQILRENLSRSNPQVAKDMAAANQTWSRMKVIEKAMSRPTGDPGAFSPTQLQTAAYGQTQSPNARMRGTGQYQDLGDAARNVLGPTLPDSGTPYGLNLKNLIATALSSVGGGTGQITAREAIPAAIGGGLLGSVYNPYGQNIIANAMIRRHPVLQAFGDPVRALTPGVTVGSIGGLLGP